MHPAAVDCCPHLRHAVVFGLHNNGSERTVRGKDRNVLDCKARSTHNSQGTRSHVRRLHRLSKRIRNLGSHFLLDLWALADVVHDAVELGQPDDLRVGG
jgi:hypothetical protein